MHDTTEEIQAMQRAAVMRMEPSARLVAAAGMYETVRALVLASLPRTATPEEVVYALLRRMYGEELSETVCRAVAVRAASAVQSPLSR